MIVEDMLIGASADTDELFAIDSTTGQASDFVRRQFRWGGLWYRIRRIYRFVPHDEFELYSVHIRSGGRVSLTVTGNEATEVPTLLFIRSVHSPTKYMWDAGVHR